MTSGRLCQRCWAPLNERWTLTIGPGRYLLTGSVRADMDTETWPGTGRVVRVAMYPLSVTEQTGNVTQPLVDRLVGGQELAAAPDTPDLRGYIDLALQGGFPEAALVLSERVRGRWLESYVEQLLTRDALTINGSRDPDSPRTVLRSLCAQLRRPCRA